MYLGAYTRKYEGCISSQCIAFCISLAFDFHFICISFAFYRFPWHFFCNALHSAASYCISVHLIAFQCILLHFPCILSDLLAFSSIHIFTALDIAPHLHCIWACASHPLNFARDIFAQFPFPLKLGTWAFNERALVYMHQNLPITARASRYIPPIA